VARFLKASFAWSLFSLNYFNYATIL